MTTTVTREGSPAVAPRGRLRDLVMAAAAPVIAAAVLIGLLSAWVAVGGAGTITRVQIQITQAVVPMRAYSAAAAAAKHSATTYLTIRNLSGTPDELISVSSPVSGHVVLTRRAGPAGARSVMAGLAIPAHGTVTLSPFGDDVVLMDPVPFENDMAVPLTLTFRRAGQITVEASVTAPGVP